MKSGLIYWFCPELFLLLNISLPPYPPSFDIFPDDSDDFGLIGFDSWTLCTLLEGFVDFLGDG